MRHKNLKNQVKIQEALAKKANNPYLRITPENAKIFQKNKKIEIHNNVRNKKSIFTNLESQNKNFKREKGLNYLLQYCEKECIVGKDCVILKKNNYR